MSWNKWCVSDYLCSSHTAFAIVVTCLVKTKALQQMSPERGKVKTHYRITFELTHFVARGEVGSSMGTLRNQRWGLTLVPLQLCWRKFWNLLTVHNSKSRRTSHSENSVKWAAETGTAAGIISSWMVQS